MRVILALSYLTLATSAVNAVSIPESSSLDLLRDYSDTAPPSGVLSPSNALEKRKGGGGRGGGGGGGGRPSGGGGPPARTRPNSNVGGATRLGSGPARTFGGGRFYGGGSTTPYTAGKRTPRGLLPGALLFPAAALLIFPGLWLWSVYPYHLNPYRFYNETFQNATTKGLNQTLPVLCLCQEHSVCGCDNNDNRQYIDDLVGNGSYAALNKTLVTVSDVNETRTLVLNGTLPNGTTAPGGTDDAAAGLRVGRYSGYWVMGVIVLCTVAFL